MEELLLLIQKLLDTYANSGLPEETAKVLVRICEFDFNELIMLAKEYILILFN